VGQGYEELWPETWEADLEEKVSQKLVCITKVSPISHQANSIHAQTSLTRQIMAHVIDESTNAFAGTSHASYFFIFHDGLSAWWEGSAGLSRVTRLRESPDSQHHR
jgi:hypothetical protein